MDHDLRTGGGVGIDLTNQPQSQSAHTLQRITRYEIYRQFYIGWQWSNLPKPGEERLTLNYCRVFVNKAASYLMSRGVLYDARVSKEDGTKDLEGSQVVERFLKDVSEFNTLPALDLDTAIEAAMLGDGAFTVRWDKEASMPRVTAVDPRGVDARWREDDKTRLTWVHQKYFMSRGELAAYLTELEISALIGQERSIQADEYWTDTEWRIDVKGTKIAGGENPYETIPYVIFPNLRVPGEFWGESDLADLLPLQQDLNKRISTFAQILTVAGNPVAVITGATPEETKELKVGPNQLWTLPKDAEARVLALLEAGGADAHFRYFDALYRAMHDISEMPRTSFGDSSGQSQARSGVALEVELQPLLHKLARKQSIWGSALKRRAHLIFKIARLHGKKIPALVELSVSFPPVLPQDRAALVVQEVALVASGIHPATKAMEALGSTDPETQLSDVLVQGKQLVDIGLLGHKSKSGAAAGGDTMSVSSVADQGGQGVGGVG